MRLVLLLKSDVQMAEHKTPNLGSWGGLKILAIGPKGGKIVGYGADGKPYYAGSPQAEKLSALHALKGTVHETHENAEQGVTQWLMALGFPVIADKGLATVSAATGEILAEHFKLTPKTKSPKAWHFKIGDLLPLLGTPLTPKEGEQHVTWAAEIAAGEANGQPQNQFPDLDKLVQMPAGKFAGSHGNQLFEHDGTKFIFKHSDPTIARAEEAATRIGQLILGDKVAPTKFVKFGGKSGALSKEVSGTPLNEANHSTPGITNLQEHFEDVAMHHVVDWLTSNHDGHAGNFLASDAGLNAIDKGQSWRFFGKDKLAIDFKPNASAPIYNTFWKAVQNGQLNGNAIAAVAKAVELAEKITPEQFEAIITPYVLTAAGKQGFDPQERIKQMTERLVNLRADWEKFLSTVYGKQVKLGAQQSDAVAAPKVEAKPQVTEPVPEPAKLAEKPKPVVAKPTAGWPLKKGKQTVYLPGDAPPPGMKWPKGAPGVGFTMEAEYKGKLYRVTFTHKDGDFLAVVTYHNGDVKTFDSPNKASDSLYLFHNGLDLDMTGTEKKAKGISLPAAKAFGFQAFAAELAQVNGGVKSADEMTVTELEAAKIVTPETPHIEPSPEPIVPAVASATKEPESGKNNFETMPISDFKGLDKPAIAQKIATMPAGAVVAGTTSGGEPVSFEKQGDGSFIMTDADGPSVIAAHMASTLLLIAAEAHTTAAAAHSGKELTQLNVSKMSIEQVHNILSELPVGTELKIGFATWTKLAQHTDSKPSIFVNSNGDHLNTTDATLDIQHYGAGKTMQVNQPAEVAEVPDAFSEPSKLGGGSKTKKKKEAPKKAITVDTSKVVPHSHTGELPDAVAAVLKEPIEQAHKWATEEIGGVVAGAKPGNWPAWVPPTGLVMETIINGEKKFLLTAVAGHTAEGKAGKIKFAIVDKDGNVHTSSMASPSNALVILSDVAAKAGIDVDNLSNAQLKGLFGLDGAHFAPGTTLNSVGTGLISPHAPGKQPKEAAPEPKATPSEDNFETMPEPEKKVAPPVQPKPQPEHVKALAEKAKVTATWLKGHTSPTSSEQTMALAHFQKHTGMKFWARVNDKGELLVGSPDPSFGFAVEEAQPGAVQVDTPLGKMFKVSPSALLKAAGQGEPVKGPDGNTYPHGTTFTTKTHEHTVKELLATEPLKVRDHKTDSALVLLKMPGSGDAQKAQLKAILEKYDLKITGEVVQGQSSVIAFLPRKELEKIAKTETVHTPHIPDAPPAFSPASFPASGLTRDIGSEAHSDPVNDLALLPAVKPSPMGHAILMGEPGIWRDFQVSARKVIDKDGKRFVEISGQLSSFNATAGSLAPGMVKLRSSVTHKDAVTGSLTNKQDDEGYHHEGDTSGQSYDGFNGTTDSGTTVSVIDSTPTFQGTFIARIPEGADVQAELAKALEKAGVNASAAMAPVEGESLRIFKKFNIVRSLLGAKGWNKALNAPKLVHSEKWLDAQLKENGGEHLVESAKLVNSVQGRVSVEVNDASSFASVKLLHRHDKDVQSLYFQLSQGAGWASRKKVILQGMSDMGAGGGTKAHGWSASTDVMTGGAIGNFFRTSHSMVGPAGAHDIIVHPRVMQRTDWFMHTGDKYGSIVAAGKGSPNDGLSRGEAALYKGGNEVMFEGGIPVEDIACVTVIDKNEKKWLIDALNKTGITQINGVSLEDFILIGNKGVEQRLASMDAK